MQAIVFDSQSLLKLYLGESGSERVVGLLREVLDGSVEGGINVVNLAEVYYILSRKSRQVAEEKVANLKSYGVKVRPVVVESPLWKRAAALKAEHAMSLADAFAAATALELSATLVTGADKEFDDIQGLRVERI